MMLFHAILQMLLLYSWVVDCRQTTCTEKICIVNGRNKELECQQNNAVTIIPSLSNITVNCSTVHMYFTSGIHILNGLINFTDSVEETLINGAQEGQDSVIMCTNYSGISFSRNRTANAKRVFISNLAFTHCERNFSSGWETAQATLHFMYASYSLVNVTVINSAGYGLYVEQSQTQKVIQCTFNNNTQGHIEISIRKIYTKVFLMLEGSKFLGSKGDFAVRAKIDSRSL